MKVPKLQRRNGEDELAQVDWSCTDTIDNIDQLIFQNEALFEDFDDVNDGIDMLSPRSQVQVQT